MRKSGILTLSMLSVDVNKPVNISAVILKKLQLTWRYIGMQIKGKLLSNAANLCAIMARMSSTN